MMATQSAEAEVWSPASPLEALEGVPWLAAVPRTTLARLADRAVLHTIPAGVRLFEQAETPAFAQLLVTGAIQLVAVRGAEETLIEVVRPFDMLLPAAVLTGQPYLVRAQVLADAKVLLIQAEAFLHAIGADHALCLATLACQAAQFRRQMRQAKAIRLRTAEERIGCYLVALAEANAGPKIRLPSEKRLIASQLGMTRETFSRALPALARRGLRVAGDTLHVDNLAVARAAFPLDPLIDGPEAINPLPLTRN